MSVTRTRPLHVGLILDTIEDRTNVDRSPRWAQIVGNARLAEAVGFDSLWISDHLTHRFPGVTEYGIWECWSLIAALAAATQRVEIGPSVLCTGFRNPALIAKMADTVDEISNGRLILAIGAGWHEPEYRAFGFPFDNRIARFEEALQIIHGLLHRGTIDFHGRYYEALDCELRPRGPRPGGPPIMIGTIAGTPLARRLNVTSSGERMLGLVARYADMWNVPSFNDPTQVPLLRGMLARACETVGRDPATVQLTLGLMVNIPGWQNHPGNPPLRGPRVDMGAAEGPPERFAEVLDAFAREGVSQVHVFLDPDRPASIETFGRTLELLDRG
jgi:alkanesulfonate monooxygenase SsuD/methylene tetrahydromethanopterin reductase-like flavin-dependent oxidoreductase (luciferase family)